MSDGLLCSDAQSVRNRRMPNGTYGGVRGRKTKVGGKLTTFGFLLLDFRRSPSFQNSLEYVSDTDLELVALPDNVTATLVEVGKATVISDSDADSVHNLCTYTTAKKDVDF